MNFFCKLRKVQKTFFKNTLYCWAGSEVIYDVLAHRLIEEAGMSILQLDFRTFISNYDFSEADLHFNNYFLVDSNQPEGIVSVDSKDYVHPDHGQGKLQTWQIRARMPESCINGAHTEKIDVDFTTSGEHPIVERIEFAVELYDEVITTFALQRVSNCLLLNIDMYKKSFRAKHFIESDMGVILQPISITVFMQIISILRLGPIAEFFLANSACHLKYFCPTELLLLTQDWIQIPYSSWGLYFTFQSHLVVQYNPPPLSSLTSGFLKRAS